jgi:hypothetical protein
LVFPKITKEYLKKHIHFHSPQISYPYFAKSLKKKHKKAREESSWALLNIDMMVD